MPRALTGNAGRASPPVATAQRAVDDHGIPKLLKTSPGVARQYGDPLRKLASCQCPGRTPAFLAYMCLQGLMLIDQRLFLPKEWEEPPERYAASGVPEMAGAYRTKTVIALSLQ